MKNKSYLSAFIVGLAVLSPIHPLISAEAQGPMWWQEQNVINANATVDDYAAVNQGQLKAIATKAYQAIILKIDAQNIHPALSGLISNWQTTPSADDYIAVNIGQVKYVASLIYDQLGITYPWLSTAAGSPNDYALANIGQIKNLFSFELGNLDYNGNGIPDWWEKKWFPDNTSIDPNAVGFASDGLTHKMKALLGFDPTQAAQQAASGGETAIGLTIHTPANNP